MKTFNVPIKKESGYSMLFFNFLSTEMQEMSYKNGKWPDVIIFNGRLGGELFNIIKDQKWDFSKFKMSVKELNPLNQLILEYSKPIKIKQEVSSDGKPSYERSESIDGFKSKGLVSPSDANKVIKNSISNSFSLEKEIRPSLKIKLSR